MAISEPLLVYFDANVIHDTIFTPNGNLDAAQLKYRVDIKQLWGLFELHGPTGTLQPATSLWSLMEVQGVIYGNLLKNNNIPKPQKDGLDRDHRYHMPPYLKELQEASDIVDKEIKSRFTSASKVPVAWELGTEGLVDFWQTVNKLTCEVAIFPPDSLHVAVALLHGCSLFITEDRDLLDKYEYCKNSVIAPLHRQLFSELDLPVMEMLGVSSTKSGVPNTKQPFRSNARAFIEKALKNIQTPP